MTDHATNTARTAAPDFGAPRRTGRLFDRMRQPRASAGASRLVAAMKLFLPAAALVLMALIVLWPQLLPDRTNFRLGDSSVELADKAGLRMERPRYVGVDRRDRPFQLTAALAEQETEQSRLVRLVEPKADMTTKSGSWTAVSADDGTYDKDAQTVDLRRNVTVFYDTGYVLSTEKALVDLKAGQVVGPGPVAGNGPAGIAEGEGLRILDNGARILFTGRSRLLIDPSAARGGG